MIIGDDELTSTAVIEPIPRNYKNVHFGIQLSIASDVGKHRKLVCRAVTWFMKNLHREFWKDSGQWDHLEFKCNYIYKKKRIQSVYVCAFNKKTVDIHAEQFIPVMMYWTTSPFNGKSKSTIGELDPEKFAATTTELNSGLLQ